MTIKKTTALSVYLKCLCILEFGLLYAVFSLSELLSNLISSAESKSLQPIWELALLYVVIVQLSFLSLGLYNTKNREKISGVITRIMASTSFGVIALLVLWPLMNSSAYNVEYISLIPAVTIIIFSLWRGLLNKLNLLNIKKRRVLVVGTGKKASYIETRMRRDIDRQGFELIGYIALKGDSPEHGVKKERIISIPQEGLVIYALENEVDEIVVAPDEPRNNLHVDELVACKVKGVNIIEMCDFVEREVGQIPTNILNPSHVAFSEGFTSNNHIRNSFDWFFNAALAYSLFMLVWPFMLITALLIKLEDGWRAPVFYSQERVGMKGQKFRIYKFRSMRLDAEKNGAQMAKKSDSRITKVGNYIRKFRIDELPQIFNIMQGDMGFVGPRPERPMFVNDFIKKYAYFDERHNVKPGLTGWAQLKYPYGASDNDSFEKLKFDLYYIKHRSFLFDILIMARTVEVVLFGKGR
jgi:sugar transferase (PEP-CTERM system associated)